MRLLVDENLGNRLVRLLQRLGHDAKRVPLTHDKDFADPFKFPPSEFPAVVLPALHPPTLERVVKALEHVLSKIPPQSFSGKLIVVSETDAFEIIPPAS